MNRRGNEQLTGLWTKEELGNYLENVKPSEDRKTLVLWDIENFKEYNLENGYGAGDQILIEIANMLSNQMRKTDIVVRYDGDIFLCILDSELKKVDDRLKEVHEYIEAESELELTASIIEITCESKENYLMGLKYLEEDIKRQKEELEKRGY